MARSQVPILDQSDTRAKSRSTGARRQYKGQNTLKAVDRRLAERLLNILGSPRIEIVLWDGQQVALSPSMYEARLVIHDRRTLVQLVADPELQFGEAYSLGRVDIEGDLVAFLEAVYRAKENAFNQRGLRKVVSDWYDPHSRNTLSNARDNIHHHYAKTIEHWLARYEAAAENVATMFDPTFVRMWRLYLAGSLAAFTTGRLQVFQVVFARAGYNRIPQTRNHVYLPYGDL